MINAFNKFWKVVGDYNPKSEKCINCKEMTLEPMFRAFDNGVLETLCPSCYSPEFLK